MGDTEKPTSSSQSGSTNALPDDLPLAATQLYRDLFASLDHQKTGLIRKSALLEALQNAGIQLNDVRVQEMVEALEPYDDVADIRFEDFVQIIRHNTALLERVLKGHLIIPDFQAYKDDIVEIFHLVRQNTGGEVADYIPQLKRVDPDLFTVSFCSVDGQQFSLGDEEEPFVIQSVCKPINYCIALEEQGEAFVHRHIGREPSGHGFNELTLTEKGLPHNPMINAGAIMAVSLIRSELPVADRFDHVMGTWQALAGGSKPGFNNAVYLSERKTADRNFALGYFMRENGAFPSGVDLIEVLEFYFQCCAVEMRPRAMAMAAATLANAGINPATKKKVFSSNTVKHCLSLMYSCGMYDFSGEFAFKVGLPGKSGVSGALMLVVPNVGGFCIYSPRLDSLGNSVRGVAFCQQLVERFNFHNYDSLLQHVRKKDPRLHKHELILEGASALCWAASEGDIHEVKRLVANGANLNGTDYDARTPLHLAGAFGQVDMVDYLLAQGADINAKDRWGHTPLDDAYRSKHAGLIEQLQQHGGVRGDH